MRGKCKYAHECRYQRYVDGKERTVVRTECWATKEPFECNEWHREICSMYKPTRLKWKRRRNTDGSWYGVCARCGWQYELVEANYCPHCGYEYKPWDGTTFK